MFGTPLSIVKTGVCAATLLLAGGAFAAQEPAPEVRQEEQQWNEQQKKAAKAEKQAKKEQARVEGGYKLSKLGREDVREIQQQLSQKGFYQGEIDGRATASTVAALGAFQHANGIPATGWIDGRTAQALGVEVAAIERDVGREGRDIGRAEQMDSFNITRLSRDEVRQLQQHLSEQGYYEGAVDGQPNAATIAALGVFQYRKELPVTGRLDERTVDALGLQFAGMQPVRGGESQVIRAGDLSIEQRKEVQRKLQQAGLYRGPIDGQFGAGTQEALRRFQKEHDLNVTGQLDSQTARLMGLELQEIQPVRGGGQQEQPDVQQQPPSPGQQPPAEPEIE